jgi:hypothetical protein
MSSASPAVSSNSPWSRCVAKELFSCWGQGADAGVGAVVIVPVQPGRHVRGPRGGAGVGPAVEPFAQRGLDEALGHAVGARSVGPCGQVARAELAKAGLERVALGVGKGVVMTRSIRTPANRAAARARKPAQVWPRASGNSSV